MSKNKSVNKAIWFCLFFLLLGGACFSDAAEIDEKIAYCAKLKGDDAARLKCFDDLARQAAAAPDVTGRSTAATTASGEALKGTKNISVMTQHWDMELSPQKQKKFFVLWPYRSNYFLPVAYNSTPNDDIGLEFDSRAKAQHNEVKFQLSFKFKLWEDIFRGKLKDEIAENTGIRGVDIWLAYTQLSFWQLYNDAFSSPFRDTNYEPELLFNFRIQRDIPGLGGTKLQFVNLGFNHQSNGRSEPLSRSWNRLVANVGLEKGSFGLQLKAWYRIPEADEKDDNPDLSRYLGYGELWGTYYWHRHRFGVMLRNNLRGSHNLGAVQLDWSIPLSMIWSEVGDKFSFYVQYFNGYGESLLDYNQSVNRISAGFMLADWN